MTARRQLLRPLSRPGRMQRIRAPSPATGRASGDAGVLSSTDSVGQSVAGTGALSSQANSDGARRLLRTASKAGAA